jgi:hypothetical protein
MLVEYLAKNQMSHRDKMLVENTVTHTLRELPAAFHAIGNASRKTLGGDYVSTDILSLTGQASPTCGKETNQTSRRDKMLVERLANQMSCKDKMLVETQIIATTRPVKDGMLVEYLTKQMSHRDKMLVETQQIN